MYAQLCKRLSEEAPNSEPEGQPCTFKLLLLNKCRTEFENRAQAFAAYEDRALAPEEEEKRHLAKCKMLGNIKFIGELGKLEILAESILHRCIQNLLARRAAAEHHEDLECLAQLVRTCGRVLDSERGRGLMDQYFARIETLSGARDLAPRIRFMLRDVVELRRGGWLPRPAAGLEGPVPIHQLRDDDEPPRRDRDRERDRDRDRDSLFRGGLRARPLDDVLAGLALRPAAPLVQPDKLFGNGFAGRDFRQRSAPAYFPRQQGKHGGGGGGGGGKEAARAPKARVAPPAALGDVQMRPAANSLMFTANRLSAARAAPPPAPPAFAPAPPPKDPPVAIKPPPDKKDKPKKDKGVSKEEACRLALEAAEAVAAECAECGGGAPDDEYVPACAPLRRLVDLQLPDKVLRRALVAVLERALGAPAEGGDAALWAACAVVRCAKRAPVGDALRAVAARGGGAEGEGGAAARLLAHALRQRLAALGDVAAWCAAPLLLEVLQHTRDARGLDALRHMLDESKVLSLPRGEPALGDVKIVARPQINLDTLVSGSVEEAEGAEGGAGGGRAERALALLEARGLGALAPQLAVRAALARQLAEEPAPGALYRWIKAHVEPAVRASPAFVSALVALLAAHVTSRAGGNDKAALEREKALLEQYAPLLTALLHARPDLQLAAVYAAHTHAHNHRYPKGMLLRWFMYLYNLEVCEEDAFLRWREDVTDAYPGKGEALFQVNTWLTWLQQQESEDEEGED